MLPTQVNFQSVRITNYFFRVINETHKNFTILMRLVTFNVYEKLIADFSLS